MAHPSPVVITPDPCRPPPAPGAAAGHARHPGQPHLAGRTHLRQGATTSPARRSARVVDLVARWDGEEPYPPVTGFVVKVGRRVAFVGMDQIDDVSPARVRLRSARLDLRDYARRRGRGHARPRRHRPPAHRHRRRPGHPGRRPLPGLGRRPAGAPAGRSSGDGAPPRSLRLVGVDVSAQTLLRRLGPRRWRDRATPDRVIDWAAIQPFQGEVPNVRLRASSEALRRLRPGELADILEDLGRPGRQELLATLEPEQAADALEEMDPDELGALLRETPPEQAAAAARQHGARRGRRRPARPRRGRTPRAAEASGRRAAARP